MGGEEVVLVFRQKPLSYFFLFFEVRTFPRCFFLPCLVWSGRKPSSWHGHGDLRLRILSYIWSLQWLEHLWYYWGWGLFWCVKNLKTNWKKEKKSKGMVRREINNYEDQALRHAMPYHTMPPAKMGHIPKASSWSSAWRNLVQWWWNGGPCSSQGERTHGLLLNDHDQVCRTGCGWGWCKRWRCLLSKCQ